MTLIVGQQQFELLEEGGTREQFLRVKRYLDGRHSVEEISHLSGVSEPAVLGVVRAFGDMGLLRCEEPVPLISAADFVCRIQDTCDMWSRQIGYHTIFRLLRSGDVRREVFLGLLIETYHYVRAAARHVAVAISHATEERWERLLAGYLVEEWDHAKLLMKTLEGVGLSRSHVESAHPVVGTLSLVGMLCDIGRRSTLAYLAATSLIEARREGAQDAVADLEAIARRYGYDPAALGPLIDHYRLDIEANHTSLVVEALDGLDYVSAVEAHRAVNHLHDLKHAFDQFHDQVLQYYSDVSNYIPRPKVDYFSL